MDQGTHRVLLLGSAHVLPKRVHVLPGSVHVLPGRVHVAQLPLVPILAPVHFAPQDAGTLITQLVVKQLVDSTTC